MRRLASLSRLRRSRRAWISNSGPSGWFMSRPRFGLRLTGLAARSRFGFDSSEMTKNTQ